MAVAATRRSSAPTPHGSAPDTIMHTRARPPRMHQMKPEKIASATSRAVGRSGAQATNDRDPDW